MRDYGPHVAFPSRPVVPRAPAPSLTAGWPAVVAGHGRATLLTPDGELVEGGATRVGRALRQLPPPLLVHAPGTLRRLGEPRLAALDLLELFLFVYPATPAAPTVRGLALALDLPPPANAAAEVALLGACAGVLLGRLAVGRTTAANRDAASLAARMGQAGWGWARPVLAALGEPAAQPRAEALKVWRHLPEWEDAAPTPAPSAHPVRGGEARARLDAMLGPGAEQRPGQADYAAAAAAAFSPREERGQPAVVLAEAGTGTGKTLGYVAPATLWAERNGAPVWVSTYTRHLQRQIEAELARLHPDPAERRRRVVLRKGRENYLCLLNYEEAVGGAASGLGGGSVVALGLLSRWVLATADGDLQGGDLPGWFADLFGAGTLAMLADRRGECVFSACPHWRRCYVEHTVRRARGADLVVANHALVMAQAAWGGIDDAAVPTRYVLDEGHHVFEAADGAFAAELSGFETAELRRWLLGAEGVRSRSRGLRRRIEDLVAGRSDLDAPLDAVLLAARALPAEGWQARLAGNEPPTAEAEPGRQNPAEAFLRALHRQVLARLGGADEPGAGTHECDLHPVAPELATAAAPLGRALARLAAPLATLRERLLARLDDKAEEIDSAGRLRIEAVCRSLRRRAIDRLQAWQAMLQAVAAPPPEPGLRLEHVLFLRLDRRGHPGGGGLADHDVALLRHWLDPTVPLAATLLQPAQGVLVTSATLRDAGDMDAVRAWEVAEARVGASHLAAPAIRVAVASPFDYPAQTRAFVVTDIAAGDTNALSAAYRTLFLASGGGGLGLFTAISRLRAVHERIAAAMEQAGIPLLAQHVDAMGNSTLVDVFRVEQESCLLGTDAMRDGVDVPGRSLRLVVFERVPWPRPDILHRARRIHLSHGDPKGYDDRIARHRLRQAFGRLIRGAGDRGAFVLLDRQTPSRLLTALPPGVEVFRVGLAEAAAQIRAFLAPDAIG